MCSLETEAHWYWLAMSEVRELQRIGGNPDLIARAVDEIEVMSLHTDWPLLRRLCVAEVASYVSLDATAS